MFEVQKQVPSAHQAAVWCVGWRKDRVVSGSLDGTLNVWDSALERKSSVDVSELGIVSVSVNVGDILSTSLDNRVCTFDISTMEKTSDNTVSPLHAVKGAFQPNSPLSTFTVGAHNGICQYTDGVAVRSFETSASDFTCAIAFSSDSSLVACGSKIGTVSIFGVAKGDLLATVKPHLGCIRSLCFSPDGSLIYSTGDDSSVCVSDVKESSTLATLQGHECSVQTVSVSPIGTHFATGDAAGKVKVWNCGDWECLATLTHQSKSVNAVAWDEAGTSFVAASSDNSLVLYKNIAQ
eukprot:TRINITY_DN8806_c0_g1_i1.p1 TRINITY_DN8806_c0_g1~~TRINITY_DN8806_c0_g1_i1.p1  ORF type:complete len:293 (-),score=51.44 TRINITY_DN8806_c0_g1_i1:196-1074(-)